MLRSILPTALALALAATASPAAATTAALPPAASLQDGRVIVLGFDGAHDQTTADLMDAGELPNLAQLREQGTFGGLLSTSPPESPVAWAALNTGTNPAKTNVIGFLRSQAPETGSALPTFGHLVKDDVRPVTSFQDAPFYAGWSAGKAGGIAFGVVFVLFFVVFALLLGMGKALSGVIAALLGAAGAYGAASYVGYLPASIPVWGNPTVGANFWDVAAEDGRRAVVVDSAMSFDMDAHDNAKVLHGFGQPDARAGLGDWFVYTTSNKEFDRPPRGFSKGLTAGTIFRVDWDGDRIETQLFGPINHWEAERLVAEYVVLGERLDDPNLGYQESAEIQRRRGEIKDALGNPRDPATSLPSGPRVTQPLVVERDLAAGTATVTIGGESQTVTEGEWSDFYTVDFALNPVMQQGAVTRVKVVHLDEPHFELFVNVLDIDPANPPFWQPVSDPIDFSQDLAAAVGPFETYGWPSATMPFKDGKISPETMLEDLEFTMKWREGVAHEAFDSNEFDLYFAVFSVTDRVQHMMYQYYDDTHPLYDAEAAAVEVDFFGRTMPRSETVPQIYREMDRIVGDFMAKLAPNDTLILCADHGFQSGRIQVHLNNWLVEQGFLVLKDGVQRRDTTYVTQYVDWERTRAYSLGMGYIYLNLKGREAMGPEGAKDGIVDPSEARAVLEEIRAALLADTDPTTGQPFVTDAYITEDIHSGEFLGREADLMVGFAPGYRISWKTGFGGISLLDWDGEVVPGVKFDRADFPSVEFAGDQGDEEDVILPGGIFEPNDSNWSGSHVSVDLQAVKGIFFMNRQVTEPEGGYDLLDIAPTVLDQLGVAVPEAMDRPPLAVQ